MQLVVATPTGVSSTISAIAFSEEGAVFVSGSAIVFSKKGAILCQDKCQIGTAPPCPGPVDIEAEWRRV
jgi:hypothetical protein